MFFVFLSFNILIMFLNFHQETLKKLGNFPYPFAKIHHIFVERFCQKFFIFNPAKKKIKRCNPSLNYYEAESMSEGKPAKKVFPICPCLFKEKDECFCLGSDDLHLLPLVVPIDFKIDLPTNEENVCHDIVYADSSGLICCGSTGLPIKVRGKLIFEEIFGELHELATSLFDPEDICRECIYNLLSFERIQRKLTFLFFTSGAPHCVKFEKAFKETIDDLEVCEEESIVKMKFDGKTKEAFKRRIKKLPTIYIIEEKRKIGEIIGIMSRKELKKILRKILGIKTT